jgi:hypothetical protein
MTEKTTQLLCPSAQPDMTGATVFGVINGTPEEPRVSYLKKEAIVDLSRLRNMGPLLPGHVFRIAAQCEQNRCVHFSGERCALAKRIVDDLQPVAEHLPSCQIRPTCRWYEEHGSAACLRCPQVVTYVAESMRPLARIAMPNDPEHAADIS